MKRFYTENQALMELLSEQGVSLVCDERMEIVVTDEDAERIRSIVAEFAPAAEGDYYFEEL